MTKKYELVIEDATKYKGKALYRIRALRDFVDVKAGDLGGYVESEKNLSQDGSCWLYDVGSYVFGNAKVEGSVQVFSPCIIKDNAVVAGDVEIVSNSMVVIKDDVVIDCSGGIGASIIEGKTNILGKYIDVVGKSTLKDVNVNSKTYIDGCKLEGTMTIEKCKLIGCEIKSDTMHITKGTFDNVIIS